MTVCPEIHTKHVNAVCVQNMQGLNVKRGGIYSNQWAPNGEHEFQPPVAEYFFANETLVYAI